ncbi:hypothetical protein C8Q75DRAFT_793300 [Abortiporus biennis]|nr:hypothetical protein C8Q75DRAFT_793300 [Abortiporus biennis]
MSVNSNGFKLDDYYHILSISPSASFSEVKLAYHRTLLIYHPDKRSISNSSVVDSENSSEDGIDVDLIKRAYLTLSSPGLRREYDKARVSNPTGPRPAQVLSLDDFDEIDDIQYGHTKWIYGCRCGGQYVATESDLESGQHLFGCSSCSEVVWVGYEMIEEADG